MKQLLYLLFALTVSLVSAAAQTLDVAPYTCSYFNGTSYVNPRNHATYTIGIDWSDTTMFLAKQESFLFGYHWGGGNNTIMERRWHINAPHGNLYSYHELDSLSDDVVSALPGKTIHAIPQYLQTTHDTVPWMISDSGWQAPIMEWRPAIRGWAWDNEPFVPTLGDSTGAIFGFEEHPVGEAQTDAKQPDFMEYVLRTSDMDSAGTPVTALRRPVRRSSGLRRNAIVASRTDTVSPAYKTSLWNGTRWYLAVNLGRLNNNDSINDTATVLTLTALWWGRKTINLGPKHDTVVIVMDTLRFDSIFVKNNSLDTLHTDRGITFRHLTFDSTATAFVIRRRDLPHYDADPMNSHITLGAFFRTSQPNLPTNDSTKAPNPLFGGLGTTSGKPVGEIDSFDIQVTYHGNCDVAIKHISLQTPMARNVLFGSQDTVVATAVDRAVRQFRRIQAKYPTKKPRIFRFYGVDETPIAFWRLHRYYNKLLDGRLTTEVDHDAYRHAVPQRDYWSGATASQSWGQLTPAVVKYHAVSDPYVPTHPGGWVDSIQNLTPQNYECHDCITYTQNITGSWDWNYNHGFPWITGRDSIFVGGSKYNLHGASQNNRYGLCTFESAAAYYYRSPTTLYSSTPNWTRHVTTSWYDYGMYVRADSSGGDTLVRTYLHPTGSHTRPQTGEEVRRSFWFSLLMGTKGLTVADGIRSINFLRADTINLQAIKANAAAQGKKALHNGIFSQFATYQNFGIAYPEVGRDYTVAGDTVGEITLRSPIVGHDFLTPTSLSNVWQYVPLGEYAALAGVDSTRAYIGLRSMRIEIMKLHDYILANEADIMNMRMMAWSGKGFNWFRTARDNDTTLYSRFVNMGWNGVKTRTIGGTSYEAWDTTHTFVDIMLHKLDGVSMDSVFIVGVQNRHSNSLVMVDSNTTHPDSIRYKFYSTAEFDSLSAMPGGLSHYAQLGSREISVPFSYTDANGRYALLRVRELGGGLDTVIGQDRSIIAKFLPGQGRFYKVEILRSNEVTGDLAHSNQTKIVSHNIMRRENGTGKWVEGDSLVYYMTYHKPAPMLPMLPPRTAVYFRKSKPTSRWDNNAALQWENEYCLTDTVYHSGRWNIGDSCAYPSIVVRFDSTSEEYRAYIVYGCIKHDTTNNPLYEWQFITESIVRINNDTAIDTVLPGIALDMVHSRDMSEWGTPMINASDTANFYCYADKNRGIIASWRRPRDLTDTLRKLVSTTRISWGDTAFCTITAQHPSMNPYSPYIRGEHHSDCALVWQESDNCDMPRRQIHYTRLFIMNNNTIFHDLPPNNITDSTIPYIVNADTSIWCVSCDSLVFSPTTIQHTFPVVYRELFYPDTTSIAICNWEALLPAHTRHDVRLDDIVWQSDSLPASPLPFYFTSAINRRTIVAIDDTVSNGYVPDTMYVTGTDYIWKDELVPGGVRSPSVSAGEAEYGLLFGTFGGFGGCFNFSKRAVSIDFMEYETIIPPVGWPVYWTRIYHVGLPTAYTSLYPTITEIADGTHYELPHLAARGTVKLNDWQRGRHIYNNTFTDPAYIRTSGQVFYKQANDNATVETLYGFGNSDSRFVMSALSFGGQDYPLQPKRALAPSLFAQPPDTLVTDWFTVGYERMAQLLSAGDAPDQVAGFIERRSDGQQWELPFARGEKRRLARLYARLVNGGDEEYRLVIHRNSDIGAFRREIVLDNPFADEGLGRSAGDMEQMLDLGSTGDAELLTIFPNPASDEVHIAVRGEERAEVIIVDAFGRTIQATAMKSGGVLAVATADFVAGIYAVRVRRSGLPDVGGRFVVVR